MDNNQNLQFNIIPFDWPREDVTFYFHRKEHTKYYRLGHRLFPYELERILPGVKHPGEDFVATSFDRPTKGFVPMDIDLQYDNKELAKRYFHLKIHAYFESLGNMVVRKGFCNNVQVWVPAFKAHTVEFLKYECFSLRVQLGSVGSLPELLIRYEHEVKVFRQSVDRKMQDVPPALFQWLLVGNRLVQYEDYVREDDADLDRAFPVLNKEIKKVSGITERQDKEGNLYKKHLRYVKGFFSKFLDNDVFREVIAIHHEFLRVDDQLIRRLPYTVKEQPFEVGAGPTRKAGIQKLKPYRKSPHAKIHLFFLAHRQHEQLIETVKRYFFQGIGSFKGLSKYAQLNVHAQKGMDIIFDDFDNPLPVIKIALDTCLHQQPADVTHFAVYISPYGRNDPDPKKRAIYYYVKHALLERGITMQVLEATKLCEPKVAYEAYLPGISVAMLAKLDGIPWRMAVPVQHELVMGVGVYEQDGERWMVVGQSFSIEGKFERFNCFRAHEMEQLAGFVSFGVRKYANEHQFPKRMVIHFHQKRDRKQLMVIEQAIKELEFPEQLPIFFVTMVGAVSKDVLAFDTGWGELMPYSGTIIKVGVREYLVFNNMRYEGGCFYGDGGEDGVDARGGCDAMDGRDAWGGFPLPVKVRVDCTDRALLKDEEGVLELLDHVHQFSRMYWRGLKQQNLPVSVLYPEMVAKMVGNFPGGRLSKGGEKGMWFL